MKTFGKKAKRISIFITAFLIISAGIISTGYIYYRYAASSYREEGQKLSTIAELKSWRNSAMADRTVGRCRNHL